MKNINIKFLSIAIVAALIAGGVLVIFGTDKATGRLFVFNPVHITITDPNFTPKLTTKTIIKGLDHPWDVGFDASGNTYYTERSKGLFVQRKNGKVVKLTRPSDLYSNGEGGMLGFTLDPDFEKNKYIYACFNAKVGSAQDVRVVRFTVAAAPLKTRKNIVTGMPASTGRHSGCRPRFGSDGYLWIGTGDAAQGTNPQNPKNLGGKVLRVDRDGKAAPGNLGNPFDSRIYSYGHRNIQGMAFYKNPVDGIAGYSVEHGTSRDDELNTLVSGNFGWDPVPGYNESTSMTDTKKFRNAVESVWSSGSPTIAPSGATIIEGDKWGLYNQALAVAVLKDKHLRIFLFDGPKKIKKQIQVLKTFGRLRSAVMGPDGNLYITTDNGNNDKIIRVTPEKS